MASPTVQSQADLAPPSSAPAQPGTFVFINDTDAHSAKSNVKRKAVRAHAARSAHLNGLFASRAKKHGESTRARHANPKIVDITDEALNVPHKPFDSGKSIDSTIKSVTLVSENPLEAIKQTEAFHVKVQEQGVVVRVQDVGSEDEDDALSTPTPSPPDQNQPSTGHTQSPSSQRPAVQKKPKSNSSAKRSPPIDPRSSQLVRQSPEITYAAPFIPLPYFEPDRPYIPLLLSHCTLFPTLFTIDFVASTSHPLSSPNLD